MVFPRRSFGEAGGLPWDCDAKQLYIILGPIDMRGPSGAATLLGRLQYGCGPLR